MGHVYASLHQGCYHRKCVRGLADDARALTPYPNLPLLFLGFSSQNDELLSGSGFLYQEEQR